MIQGLQENVPLRDYTTYKIGGPARYFLVATSADEVVGALAWAKEQGLEVLVLGGGSNLLVADQGFGGLALKIEINGLRLVDGKKHIIEAGAGVSMQDAVDFSLDHSLEGLEWAGGLPGSFGGAVRGNAGAFGGEMKDSVMEVTCVNGDLEVVTLSNAECNFAYRSSIFKEKGWVVLSAVMQLKPGDKDQLRHVAESRKQYRKDRHPLEYPNSGSVFKNVPVEAFFNHHQESLKPIVKKDPFEVVPTAFLLSELGLKGRKAGNAMISDKHPNFLVNLGGAKAEDIRALIGLIREEVKAAYGVDLEVEVQLVGFDK